jgi:hypothetical protein
MVTLDTLRALHEHEHQLAAYCPTCERWAVLDLEQLIAAGRGDYVFVGWTPRCSYCRGPGSWQLRPPALRSRASAAGASISDATRPACRTHQNSRSGRNLGAIRRASRSFP